MKQKQIKIEKYWSWKLLKTEIIEAKAVESREKLKAKTTEGTNWRYEQLKIQTIEEQTIEGRHNWR